MGDRIQEHTLDFISKINELRLAKLVQSDIFLFHLYKYIIL